MPKRELCLWGQGGYYWLDVDEKSGPSIPAGDRAWQMFLAFAPEGVVWDIYERLLEACEAEERCQTGSGTAASGAKAPPRATQQAMAEFRARVPIWQRVQGETLRRRLLSGSRERVLLQPFYSPGGVGLN